jgi:thiol:disulfide interchange protein DsbA
MKLTLRPWLVSLLFLFSTWVHASYQEGNHYVNMSAQTAENYVIQEFFKSDAHPVQILEFFNYGCHWCYELEPLLQHWLKDQTANNFVFRRVPVVFHPAWRPLAKAYYTAFSLENNAAIDTAFFRALHEDQKMLTETSQILALFVEQGVSAEVFDKTYGSFSVNRQLKEANQLAVAFRVTAIPLVIVHGPKGTYATAPHMAGSQENTIHVLNELIKKVQ